MPKRNPNPVSKHFVFSEETRKSTCKKCRYDMAGRHSENLLRHLKRKHEDLYKEVVAEKRVIRQAIAVRTNRSLANIFKFPSEPKKIRLSKDASQLPTNSTTNSTTMETTVMVDNEEAGDGDYEDNASGSQFDIFIGKSELPDEDDNQTEESDTAVELLPITEAKPGENEPDLVPISVPKPGENEPELVAKPSTSLKASSSSGANVRASTSDCPLVAGDNAIYLQYLGNKFGKYSKRTMNTVQFHINRILYMADMGHFEEKEGNPTGESDSN
ncbi:uncharacterized protein [Drosophila takahashii]|uniref:uncharacterized protein isoform X2 n=1 Tax=Drosophila takahashii TaxID=29030 RepID=UPI001CF89B71|nr:uncharacterized protein LOC108056457 isoform X2 [Drosophila takahashii]